MRCILFLSHIGYVCHKIWYTPRAYIAHRSRFLDCKQKKFNIWRWFLKYRTFKVIDCSWILTAPKYIYESLLQNNLIILQTMSSSEFGPMFVKKRFVLPLKMILHCTTVYVFWTKRWAHTMWSVNVGFPLFMVVHKIKSDSTRFIEQAGTFYPKISCPCTLGPVGIICLVRSNRVL